MKDSNRRPRIGIITASACQSEQRQILDGIIRQAQALGADTAIFSNIYNSSEYFANIEAENKIYDLILSQKLDGLILTAESILNLQLQQEIYQRLLCRRDIPIVVTGAQLPGFPCIDNDVAADIRQITDHLIDVHHFTQIDLLTGPQDNESARLRVAGYRAALEAHGIPFGAEHVIYGDFWMTAGEALANAYISGKRRLPQAVVCCNDYMAYGLCDTLALSGISIPRDVTVMGYEYVGGRYYHAPILSTYQRNRQQVGALALRQLWHMIYGTELEPVDTRGYLIPGNSCTCGADHQQVFRELHTVRQEQYYTQLNLTGDFEQQLCHCNSIQEYVYTLQDFAFLIRGVVGVYLCLQEDWCQSRIAPTGADVWDSDQMVCYRIISPESYPERYTEGLFRQSELYPDAIVHPEHGCVLYFCPVFFSGRTLGYIILQYDRPDGYDMIFREWLKIASYALEMLRMKNDIHTLLARCELSALHDSTTGLYNAKGMRHELEHAVQHAQAEDTVLWILIRSAHMPDRVNLAHRRAHVELDQKIADCIQQAHTGQPTLCGKLQDNLYALAAVGRYTPEDGQFLADRLEAVLQQLLLQSGADALGALVICLYHAPVQDFVIDQMIGQLQAQMHQKLDQISAQKQGHQYTDYAALRRKIYLSPQEDWNAQRLCCDFCRSCGRFRSTYKALFGISFHQDIIRARLMLAKYLLLTTKMTVASIAGRCGYEDDKHFMHQFKQATGHSPNQYRQ